MIRRVAVALVLAGVCLAQDTVARMDQVAQSFVDSKSFMGSVLVARKGDVLLSKGYGFANLEWKIPNSPSTKFRLGSVTKQFTAACILLLEDRGKLQVNDLVKKYMPDAPASWDKVTIYHLLTHTSGIPDFTRFPDYGPTETLPSPVETTIARFRDKPLDFEPSAQWSYDNSGYVLLGYLIEKISGKPYGQFLQENIFTPLAMKDSGYDSNSSIIERRASGYAPSPNGPVNATFVHMSIPHAAGALYSTTEDLMRWESALFGGKILSAASLQKMTTPFQHEYACGLAVRTVNGRKVIDHGGAINGFNTHLAYYPEDQLTVVVLGNLSGRAPDDIATKLGAVAHGDKVQLPSERKSITVSPKTLSDYVGTYVVSPGFSFEITLEGGQLMTHATGQPKRPLLAESDTRFFLKDLDGVLFEFFRDDKGVVTRLVRRQGGGEMRAQRK